MCVPDKPECGDAEAPICNGVCQEEELCHFNKTGGFCECVDYYSIYCGETAAPVCGGYCDWPMDCVNVSDTDCECRECKKDAICGGGKYSYGTGVCYSDAFCRETGGDAEDCIYDANCTNECLGSGYTNISDGYCYTDNTCTTKCNYCDTTTACNVSCGGYGFSNDGGATCYSNEMCLGWPCNSSCTVTYHCWSECGYDAGWTKDAYTCYLADNTCSLGDSECCAVNRLCNIPCGTLGAYMKGGRCYNASDCSGGSACSMASPVEP